MEFPLLDGLRRADMTVIPGVLQESGEKVLVQGKIIKPRYAFPQKQFLALATLDMAPLVDTFDQILTKQELILTLRLLQRLRKNNLLIVRAADVRQWGIGKVVLSRTLGKLVRCGFLRRNSPGSFTANPNYVWVGKTGDHREAIEEWRVMGELLQETEILNEVNKE